MNVSDYIVNPMWFYWLHLSGQVRALCFGVFIAYICFGIVGFFIILSEWDCWDKEFTEKVKRLIKRSAITAAIILLIGMAIPSKRTLIEMQVARHATYSNLEKVEEKIQNATDYILEKLKSDE